MRRDEICRPGPYSLGVGQGRQNQPVILTNRQRDDNPKRLISRTKPGRGQGQALVSILEIETTWPIDAAFLCNRSHKKDRISYIRNGHLPFS